MISAKTCFVAEGIAVDQDTGQVSAYSLVEDLAAASHLVLVQKLGFFMLCERAIADPARIRGEFSVTLECRDILCQLLDIDLGTGLRNRCTIRVDSLAPDGARLHRVPARDSRTCRTGVRVHDGTTATAAGAGREREPRVDLRGAIGRGEPTERQEALGVGCVAEQRNVARCSRFDVGAEFCVSDRVRSFRTPQARR